MRKKIQISLILVQILFSALLFRTLAVRFKGELYKHEKMVEVYPRRWIAVDYNLPHQETLFLKIKTARDFPVERISFNGRELTSRPVNLRGVTYTYSIEVPGAVVSPGKNSLQVGFPEPRNMHVDVRLSNYRKSFSDNLAILFPDSHVFRAGGAGPNIFLILLAAILISLALTAAALFLAPGMKKFVFYALTMILPINVILGILHFVHLGCGFRLAMSDNYFFRFLVFGAAITGGMALGGEFLGIGKRKKKAMEVQSTARTETAEKISFWFKRREFTGKCLIAAFLLLVLGGAFSILELKAAARHSANAACFILATGVIGKMLNATKKMRKKIQIFLILIQILLSIFLFRTLAVKFKGELYKREKMVEVYPRRWITVDYDLPQQETLFLKIKTARDFPVERISLNGRELTPRPVNLRGVTYTYSIEVPGAIVFPGKNRLEVGFPEPREMSVDVRLSNYRKSVSDKLVVLFPDSHVFRAGGSGPGIFPVFLAAGLICLVLVVIFFLAPSVETVFFYAAAMILPMNFVLGILHFVHIGCGFRLGMSDNYFFRLQVFGVAVTGGMALGRKFLGIGKRRKKAPEVLSPARTETAEKIGLWLEQREFPEKCLITAFLLLVLGGAFLVLELQAAAEQSANAAYFILAAGVIGKILKSAKKT